MPGGFTLKWSRRFLPKNVKMQLLRDPDSYGRTYELSDEALGIAGMRAVAIDPVASMKYKIADFTRGVSNCTSRIYFTLIKRWTRITRGNYR